MKPALLVVDMLHDFVRGKLGDDRFEHIVPNIEKLLKEARANNVPVFYCNDSHQEGDPELEIWGKHAMKGSDGAKVIKELRPKSTEEIVEKHCYGGFDGTDLNKRLQQCYNGKGADSVIICGLHTHLCDRHTAYGAFWRGYKVIFASDATQAFSDRLHKQGIEYVKENYGAEILSSKKLLSKFKKID